MIYNILYLVLAALGLGVLVFIHELGHYFMARKEGMKIETFSIGFGKPILSWDVDGVKWQVCWVPIGGYVRIAGMEKKGSLEPYQIPDGFYGKKPLARIKVALAGPFVNIVFAMLLFCVIWSMGGREKPFSSYTHLIGWVSPSSDLYEIGVRPGDEIACYGKEPFQGFNQLLSSALLDKEPPTISGYKIDYAKKLKVPFTYTPSSKAGLNGQDKLSSALSLMTPATYLIYKPDALSSDAPMKGSGIESGDRILWVDGELVFSRRQLAALVNEPKVLLTVRRDGSEFLTRIPRLQIGDLRLNPIEKAELQDSAYANNFKEALSDLYFIPYGVSPQCAVEYSMSYIDESASEKKEYEPTEASPGIPLQKGDVIVAVDGSPVDGSASLLNSLQTRHVQVVVQRGVSYPPVSWKMVDESFMGDVSFQALTTLTDSIGTASRLQNVGSLFLLNPIEPKPFSSFSFTDSIKEKVASSVLEQKKAIEEIKNPKERAIVLKNFEKEQNKLLLGGLFEDRAVSYNPSPLALFEGVFNEMWRTLRALFTGYLSPKYMAGPVGIVQVMQQGWGVGVKEALFWIAIISVNLGFVNLLPIPVLDGGHVCFALYEMVTKKPIKSKTMERMIIPFVILIVAFFIYATYHDVIRIFFRSF